MSGPESFDASRALPGAELATNKKQTKGVETALLFPESILCSVQQARYIRAMAPDRQGCHQD